MITDLPAHQKLRCLIIGPRAGDSWNVIPRMLNTSLNTAGGLTIDIVAINPKGEGGLATETFPLSLETADALIADLTGADPDVMYELGFAHAMKKPVLPIVQKGSAGIPSVLHGYLYYVYDPSELVDLTNTVRCWLHRTLKEQHS